MKLILLKVFIVDRIIEEDGVKGDQYGPFDLETQKYERKRLLERKEREREEREATRRRLEEAQQLRQTERENVARAESEDEDDDDY